MRCVNETHRNMVQCSVVLLTSGSWRARPRRQDGGTAFMASVKISNRTPTAGDGDGDGDGAATVLESVTGP